MKYGLFAAIAFAFVALIGGAASAGVGSADLGKAAAVPAASIVHQAGARSACYHRCRAHGHTRRHCRRKCGWWWF
jgi:hypothetical protein